MKLIDILVQELPKRGGWPKGAEAITQDSDKSLNKYNTADGLKTNKYGSWECSSAWINWLYVSKGTSISLASDYATAIITREQYASALAASKQEWDGEGLPPVGCRVEVKADDFEGGWLVIDVAYVHNGEVIGIVQSENEYLNDRLEKFSAGYNRAEFRPIRSQADKKRDVAIDELVRLIGISPESAAICYDVSLRMADK